MMRMMRSGSCSPTSIGGSGTKRLLWRSTGELRLGIPCSPSLLEGCSKRWESPAARRMRERFSRFLYRPPLQLGRDAMQPLVLDDAEEALQRGHVLAEREVHVQLGAAVAARGRLHAHGEDALEELLAQDLVGAAGGEDVPRCGGDLAAQFGDDLRKGLGG